MNEELVKLALSLGWVVDRTIMYEEGWEWSHTDMGRTFSGIGLWSEGPVLPPELEEILLLYLRNDPKRVAQ